MFIAITGKPRSGKSAYAVDFMLRNKDRYHNIYSDINGLKKQDNIKLLNFNYIHEVISSCKSIYDDQIDNLGLEGESNVIDDPIIDYLLDIGFIVLNDEYDFDSDKNNVPKFKPTLIIIDEAHNHFPARDKKTGALAKVDPILLWWISYHGHLYMDVFLITQNYKKIHEVYLYDIEFFLDAVSSSLSLSRQFVYKHYVATPYYKTNLAKKIKVKKRKEIFNAYVSGDKVRSKSVILPLLYLSAIGVFIFVVFMYFIKTGLLGGSSSPKEVSHKKYNSSLVSSAPRRKQQRNTIKILQSKYLALTCVSTVCKNRQYDINLQLDDIKALLKDTDSKFLRSTRLGKNLSTIYFLASPTFLGLFKKRSYKNEKGFSLMP